MQFLLVALYLILTVSGLILYKLGANQEFVFTVTNGIFNIKMSIISFIGLICYIGSFLIYLFILPKFNLSYIMPIMSAISYIGIFILSILILNEKVTTYGIIGSIVILIGILIMNLGTLKELFTLIRK